jgi:hypothetical protein
VIFAACRFYAQPKLLDEESIMKKKCPNTSVVFQHAKLLRIVLAASLFALSMAPLQAAEGPAPGHLESADLSQLASADLNQSTRGNEGIPPTAVQPQASEPQSGTKVAVQASTTRGNTELTPGAREIAEITGMMPVWNQLRAEQEKNANDSSAVARSVSMAKLIYYRQRLMQAEQTVNFEVDSTRVSIETELAKLDDIQAALTERRARSLMRNTVINFVSGGVTKLAGYSLALGAADTPTNLLEIFDGGIQCALSAMTVKEQRVERQIAQKDVTPLLTTISDRSNARTRDYPESVWQFLSRVPPDSTDRRVRLEYLAQTWENAGLMGNKRKRPSNMSFGLSMRKELASQLVEDRTAMLTDVKSVVSQMQNGLMDFSRALKQTYLDDPVVD